MVAIRQPLKACCHEFVNYRGREAEDCINNSFRDSVKIYSTVRRLRIDATKQEVALVTTSGSFLGSPRENLLSACNLRGRSFEVMAIGQT
jgi:hypothetical protein